MTRSGQQPLELDRQDVAIEIPNATRLLMELQRPKRVALQWTSLIAPLVYLGIAAMYAFTSPAEGKMALMWAGFGLGMLLLERRRISTEQSTRNEQVVLQLFEELVAQNSQQKRDLEHLTRQAQASTAAIRSSPITLS